VAPPITNPPINNSPEVPATPDTPQVDPPVISTPVEEQGLARSRPRRTIRPPDRYGHNICAHMQSPAVPNHCSWPPAERETSKTQVEWEKNSVEAPERGEKGEKLSKNGSCPLSAGCLPHNRYSHRAGNGKQTMESDLLEDSFYEEKYPELIENSSETFEEIINCEDFKLNNKIRNPNLGNCTIGQGQKRAPGFSPCRDFELISHTPTVQETLAYYHRMAENNAQSGDEDILDLNTSLEEQLLALEEEQPEVESWNQNEATLLLGEKNNNNFMDMEIIKSSVTEVTQGRKPVVPVARKENYVKEIVENKLNNQEELNKLAYDRHFPPLRTSRDAGVGGETASSAAHLHHNVLEEPVSQLMRENNYEMMDCSPAAVSTQTLSAHADKELVQNLNKVDLQITWSDSAREVTPTQVHPSKAEAPRGGNLNEPIDLVVVNKEPGELDSSDEEEAKPTTSTRGPQKRTPGVHRAPHLTWVSAETMLQVKRALKQRGDDAYCNLCQWTGTPRRTKVHIKQHYVLYLCLCGLHKTSRDAVYDHQVTKSRQRATGHGPVPGHIFEVDYDTYAEFRTQHSFGPEVFPQLHPTQTGVTQTGRNKSAQPRKQSTRGKQPRNPLPRDEPTQIPVLRITPVADQTPVRLYTSKMQHLYQRRIDLSIPMIQEATQLEDRATRLYRESCQDDLTNQRRQELRRRAKQLEEEADRYRKAAEELRGSP
jgi:hypothetical protein